MANTLDFATIQATLKAQLAEKQTPKSAPKADGRKGRPQSLRLNENEFGQSCHSLARMLNNTPKEDDQQAAGSLQSAPNVTIEQTATGTLHLTGKFYQVSDSGLTVSIVRYRVGVLALASGNNVIAARKADSEWNPTERGEDTPAEKQEFGWSL
jgi:hypothetical protein